MGGREEVGLGDGVGAATAIKFITSAWKMEMVPTWLLRLASTEAELRANIISAEEETDWFGRKDWS